MAFRKKFKTSRFRTFPRGKLARVRRTWHPAYNVNWCDAVGFTPQWCVEGNAPTTNLQWLILDQPTLASQFSDRAKVTRIIGDLWLFNYFNDPPPASEFPTAMSYANTYQWFAGLRRQEVNNNGTFLPLTPLENDFDFSEGKWLKTWRGLKQVQTSFGFLNGNDFTWQAPVQCIDTHTDGVTDNILTDGSGTINIVTDCMTPTCFECPQTGMSFNGVSYENLYRPLHVRILYKGKVSLRENQQLAFDLSMAMPYLQAYAANQPVGYWFGQIKALIEF